MSTWKKFKDWMENIMAATAYSDANERDEAVRLSGIGPGGLPSLDSLTTAITFAEANEHDIARETMGVKDAPAIGNVLDIPGIRVWVGTVSMEAEPVAIPGVRVWSGRVSI